MTLLLTDWASDDRGEADAAPSARAFSRWGARAATVYTDSYARRYRDADEAAGVHAGFSEWLRGVCARFDHPFEALDLGCGTGRYFQALSGARRLVGIDVSGPMLEYARRPIGVVAMPAGWLTLVEGDFLQQEFRPGEFDLVYSIGVLAEHAPFDQAVAARVRRWLRPGGRFAFTTVHPLSFSVPRTMKRRAGEWLASIARGRVRRALRSRLMSEGIYADEERVREVLGAEGFAIETIEVLVSDVHQHMLVVAVKRS